MANRLCQYSSLPALILDADGKVLQVNAAFQEYWGADPEKTRGSEGYSIFNDPLFCQKGILNRLEKALRGMPVLLEPMEYAFPQEYCHGDRVEPQPRAVSIFAIPFSSQNGSHTLALFYYDETVSHLAGQEESQCERLNAVAAALEDLKHEINNPLLLIIGHAQLLLAKSGGLTPEVARKLEKILNSAEKIRNIIQDRQHFADLLLTRENAECLEL